MPVYTQNDPKRIVGQKRRFSTIFRVTAMTKPFSESDAKRILGKNVVLAADLEQQ